MPAKSASVGVRELRQNLSVYLDRVKKGQVLTVTEHGRIVAELRPLVPKGDAPVRLVADGRVTPARRRPSDLPAPLRLKLGRSVSALLDDARDDAI